jgi:predicted transglutaminase-like cysteine proteinase
MKTKELILSAAALIALSAPAAFAQQSSSSPAATPADAPASIAQRKDNQQDRIANGIDSGQLTAGETKNLETKEADVNKEEHTMRTEDDGHLTTADRTTLDRQQNHLSDNIYDDKHNANAAHYGNGEIGQRRQDQQDRIAQGVKSGQLTAGETSKLENQQQGINREIGADKQANGGKLTGLDKKSINQSQNRASRNIYGDKHNARRVRG